MDSCQVERSIGGRCGLVRSRYHSPLLAAVCCALLACSGSSGGDDAGTGAGDGGAGGAGDGGAGDAGDGGGAGIAPVITITSHIDGQALRGERSFTLEGTITDDGTVVSATLSLDGAASTPLPINAGAFSVPLRVPDMQQSVQLDVTATDDEGIVSTSAIYLPYVALGLEDTSFGVQGIARHTLWSNWQKAIAATTDASGRIYVATAGARSALDGVYVIRLSAAGVLDTTFGVQGIATPDVLGGGTYSLPFVSGIALDQTGRILVSGSRRFVVNTTAQWDTFLLGLTEQGQLDTAFGSGGIAHTQIDATSPVGPLAVDGFGNAYVSSGATDGRGSTHAGAVIKFGPTGAVDIFFKGEDLGGEPAPTGYVLLKSPIPDGFSSDPQHVTIDNDGRVLLDSWLSPGFAGVWRLLPTGARDETFGGDIFPADGAPDGFWSGPQGGDGAVVSRLHNGQIMVAILQSDGSSDLRMLSPEGSETSLVQWPASNGVFTKMAPRSDAVGNLLAWTNCSAGASPVYRITPAGTPDTTFGPDVAPANGVPDALVTVEADSCVDTVLVAPSGDIVVVGRANATLAPPNQEIRVWRFR